MPDTWVVKITRYGCVLFGGLLAGFVVAVLGLELALRGFDAQVYLQVRRVEYDSFTWLAAVTFVPALVATVALVVLTYRARHPALRPALTALALLVVMLAVTLVINGPINFEQLDWNLRAPPADWASVRDRWQLAHAIRTAASLVVFGCLSVAVMATSPMTEGYN